MCGIVGRFGAGSPGDLEPALAALRHRGPDSEGTRIGPGWAMGIRRLAIIDVSHGDQPLSNEDGSIWVVCNGEIYNHLELQKDLKARGHRFRTGSDAEVIVHLFEEFGEQFVERLQGMFALFLATPRGCYVARDRLGIKPLYRLTTPAGVYFASEIRALRAVPSAPPAQTEASRVSDYFVFRYVPEPRTAFVGIDRVPAGHLIRLDANGEQARRYWRLEQPAPYAGSFADAVAECRSRLQGVVAAHLMSERPLGVFLSGGLDSSVLAALAVQSAGSRVHLLTAAFPDSDRDETEHARRVAEHLGAPHHVLPIPRLDLDTWRHAVAALEDLVSEPAAIPLWLLSRLARDSMTVAFLGEGSDEVHLGYSVFARLRSRAARRRWARFLPWPPMRGRWADRLGWPAEDEFGFLARFTNLTLPPEDFPAFLPGLPPPPQRLRDRIEELTARLPGPPALRDRVFRLEGWMKDDLLTKVDKTTMAWGIEARVPYLDHTYVEWSLTLPVSFALRGGRTKAVLRAVAEDLLPAAITSRKQHGFLLPLARFLDLLPRQEMLEMLRSREALWRTAFEAPPIEAHLLRFERGDLGAAPFLFQLLQGELWRRTWL